jgi:hypothetical protein
MQATGDFFSLKLCVTNFLNILFACISCVVGGGVVTSIYAYNVPWLESSLPSVFLIPMPPLKTILTDLIIWVLYKYINHIHPLHLPFPLLLTGPNGTCFTFLSFIFFSMYSHYPKAFHHNFHPWISYILMRLTPFVSPPYPFPLHPIIQQLSVHFVMPSSYMEEMCFDIIHYHSFFSPSSS